MGKRSPAPSPESSEPSNKAPKNNRHVNHSLGVHPSWSRLPRACFTKSCSRGLHSSTSWTGLLRIFACFAVSLTPGQPPAHSFGAAEATEVYMYEGFRSLRMDTLDTAQGQESETIASHRIRVMHDEKSANIVNDSNPGDYPQELHSKSVFRRWFFPLGSKVVWIRS